MTYQTIVLELQYDCHSHCCVCAFWWTLDNSIHWKQQRNNRDESLLIVSVTGQFTTWPFQLVKSIIILLLRFLIQVFRQQETALHSDSLHFLSLSFSLCLFACTLQSAPERYESTVFHMSGTAWTTRAFSVREWEDFCFCFQSSEVSVGSYSLWICTEVLAQYGPVHSVFGPISSENGEKRGIPLYVMHSKRFGSCEVAERATVHANNCNQREWLRASL